MIRFIGADRLTRATHAFGSDPFGVRALAGILAYGTDTPFVGAWVQGKDRLLIGKTEAALTLCGRPSDSEEAASFLQVAGGNHLLLPTGMLTPAQLPEWQLRRTGVVMELTEEIPVETAEIGTAETAIALLSACQSPWLEIIDRDAVYTDLSHRVRHQCIRIRVVRSAHTPAACALTIGETDTAALIGGVACLSDYRGQGLAGQALRALCTSLTEEHKRVFVFTGAELTAFYRKNGFAVQDEWEEYVRKEIGCR